MDDKKAPQPISQKEIDDIQKALAQPNNILIVEETNTRNVIKERKKRSVSKTRTSELKNYSPEGTRIEAPTAEKVKISTKKMKKAVEKKIKQKLEDKMK